MVDITVKEDGIYQLTISAIRDGFTKSSVFLTLFINLIPSIVELNSPNSENNRLAIIYSDTLNTTINFRDENGFISWDIFFDDLFPR